MGETTKKAHIGGTGDWEAIPDISSNTSLLLIA